MSEQTMNEKNMKSDEAGRNEHYPHTTFTHKKLDEPGNVMTDAFKMYLEGTDFFDHNHAKLNNLRGKPVTWKDYAFDLRWMISWAAFISVSLYIIIVNCNMLGELKLQKTVLNYSGRYDFDASSQMKMLMQHQFFVSELLVHIRAHQQNVMDAGRQLTTGAAHPAVRCPPGAD